MRPLIFALTAISLCILACLALMAIAENIHATPLDTALDVCPPPVTTPIAKMPPVPEVPSNLPGVPAAPVAPATLAATNLSDDLNNQIAMVSYHVERRCGPTGCQLVRVPNVPACSPAAPQACAPPQACSPAVCSQVDSGDDGQAVSRGPVRRLLGALRPRAVVARMQARRGG